MAPVIRGRSLYHIYEDIEGINWLEASIAAEKLGGSLPLLSGNDYYQEAGFVHREFADILVYVYLGLKAKSHSELEWADGTIIAADPKYVDADWKSIDRNKDGRIDEFENLHYELSNYRDFALGSVAILNFEGRNEFGEINFTDPSEYYSERALLEIPFTRYKDSAYISISAVNWHEANLIAKQLGGTLVTIQDKEENDFISNFARERALNAFIGISDSFVEGEWLTEDKSKPLYTNWSTSAFGLNSNQQLEDFGIVWGREDESGKYQKGQWSAVDSSFSTIGIVEFKLSPNNVPSGRLIIDGFAIPGETISILSSSITDIDGILGQVKVFWEYFDELKSQWIEIPDAISISGTSTLLVNNQLLGKKIRGAASFTDGYGSDESIYSETRIVATPSDTLSNAQVTIKGKPNIGSIVEIDVNQLSDDWFIKRYGYEMREPGFDYIFDLSDLAFEADANAYNSMIYYNGGLIRSYNASQINYNFLNFLVFRSLEDTAVFDRYQYSMESSIWESVDHLMAGNETSFNEKSNIDRFILSKLSEEATTDWRLRSSKTVIPESRFTDPNIRSKLGVGDTNFNYTIKPIDVNSDGLSDAIGFAKRSTTAPPISINGTNLHVSAEDWIRYTKGNSKYEEIKPDMLNKQIRGYVDIQHVSGYSTRLYTENINVVLDDEFLADSSVSSLNHLPMGQLYLSKSIVKIGSPIQIIDHGISDIDGIKSQLTYGWEYKKEHEWVLLPENDISNNGKSLLPSLSLENKILRGFVTYIDGKQTQEKLVTAEAYVVSPSLDAEYQYVSSSNQYNSYIPSGVIRVPLLYSASTADSNLSGLSLNVHYNSSILTPTSTNNGVSEQAPATISTNKIVADTNNLDGDPLTDKILQLIWTTFDNTFPNKTLPTTLATLNFNTSSQMTDPVTGKPTSTTIRYTASETAATYDFVTGSTNLTALPFSLDVDGDGQVKALTDGLMIIRKLLGPAFDGEALTFKAISSGATRSTEEIHTYIQGAIDSGMLDVDKNNKTTALTDGLMVIRRLLGPAFDGDALTFKALASDSPYFGKTDAFTLVSTNIDSLISFSTTIMQNDSKSSSPSLPLDPILTNGGSQLGMF